LTWDKIDLRGYMIRLEPEDTKEGKTKSIPISKEVYSVLTQNNRHIRNADSERHVFLYFGKPIDHFTTALKTACGKAGVEKSVRMSITGHAIRDMDDRYNKVDDADKHQAIKKLEAFRSNVRQNVRQTPFEKEKALQVNEITGPFLMPMAEVHGNRIDN